jgi:cytochrome c-type biogenesis protein CcmH
VLPTLLQRSPAAEENTSEEANVEVYRDQLSELDADLANGIVSPEQYRQDREELERRMLEDVATRIEAKGQKAKSAETGRAAAYGVAAGIPVLAVALYLLVGNSAALSGVPPQTLVPAGPQGGGQMSQQDIEANVAKLAKRMEANPSDADGWAMLGRSYVNLEKYTEASNAYAKATALKANDADLLTEYAFALAMSNDRQLAGQPFELIKKALQIAPENPKAIELAGSAAFQAKNYKEAIDYWQKLLAKTDPNSELGQSIVKRIDEAKSLASPTAK